MRGGLSNLGPSKVRRLRIDIRIYSLQERESLERFPPLRPDRRQLCLLFDLIRSTLIAAFRKSHTSIAFKLQASSRSSLVGGIQNPHERTFNSDIHRLE